MTAEELIRRRLTGDATLAAALAKYGGEPAVFYAAPASDSDATWQGGKQYPRIEFAVDWRNEPEHGTGGAATVQIVSAETEPEPEPLAAAVRKALSGVFYIPSDGHVFALSWESTQPYQMKAEVHREALINGLDMAFRLAAFPERETADPDPVMAFNRYAKRWEGVALVRDLRGDYHEPTDSRPVVYFRVLNKATAEQTNTVVWVNAEVAMHLYAPGVEARQMWLEVFTQGLALDGEVTMLDNSPMFVRSVRGTATADETSGQLTISARYGLLRRPRYAHPLMHSYWNKGGPGAVEEHAKPI